jgi:hypothetical protein
MEEGGYDEGGILYRIPAAILSDPTNLLDDEGDEQTVVGTGDIKELPKAEANDDMEKQPELEPTTEDKGKAVVDKDAIKVKCRLSDRGGPDVIVFLGKTQNVGLLTRRVRDEGDVSSRPSTQSSG